MAANSLTFWRDFENTVHPPANWPRVYVVPGIETLRQCAAWCGGSENEGEYCWTRSRHVPEYSGSEPKIVWAFSDPKVAFEFKLRFG